MVLCVLTTSSSPRIRHCTPHPNKRQLQHIYGSSVRPQTNAMRHHHLDSKSPSGPTHLYACAWACQQKQKKRGATALLHVHSKQTHHHDCCCCCCGRPTAFKQTALAIHLGDGQHPICSSCKHHKQRCFCSVKGHSVCEQGHTHTHISIHGCRSCHYIGRHHLCSMLCCAMLWCQLRFD